MRITNSMISNNSKTNINSNKVTVDKLNTQMTTQKKISRPSEDPVIAIRALRLRSNLNELYQYYKKNIPDAESWLELTETALDNMEEILTEVYRQCTNGSTDSLSQSDRGAILQNLQALREQVYAEGNADYAGRTVFTGYKTNSQLTFGSDEPDTTYDITEKVSFENIEEKRYYANQITVPASAAEVSLGAGDPPEEVINFRIRLSYGELDEQTGVDVTVTLSDGTTQSLNTGIGGGIQTTSYADWEAADFAVGDTDILFIPETGELILGKQVSEDWKSGKAEMSVDYTKTGFTKGEIRPEHYFDCENVTDPANTISYTKENQEIKYTIAFNQSLTVNTQASDVFDADIGRDIDELTDAVSAAIAANEKVEKIKEMMKQEQYADAVSQEMLTGWLEAAQKEADLMDDNMQKLYGNAITRFQGYLDNVTLAKTDVGSKVNRLELTKTRVSNQYTVFEQLKSTNEDRELSDIIIDYTAAYTAYENSLMAASKANQQTLLNYL